MRELQILLRQYTCVLRRNLLITLDFLYSRCEYRDVCHVPYARTSAQRIYHGDHYYIEYSEAIIIENNFVYGCSIHEIPIFVHLLKLRKGY